MAMFCHDILVMRLSFSFCFCITDASLHEFSNFLKNLEEQREILVSFNKHFKKLFV